jgi:cytochrome P450
MAIEELLRAYSPVTMARIVDRDIEFQGCPMKAGDRVLMAFPAFPRCDVPLKCLRDSKLSSS